MKRILFVSNHLRHTCGITSHLYYLAKELQQETDIQFTFLCGGGDAVEKFISAGWRVEVVPSVMHETRSMAGFLQGVLQLRKVISAISPDVIHSHHYYAANIVSFAAVFKSIVRIQTIHGLIPPAGRLPHYNAHRYIGVNPHITEELRKQKQIGSGKAAMIPCGYPFSEGTELKKVTHPIRFITASRLIKEKGIHHLIEAVKQLHVTNTVAEFTIAGDGADSKEFVSMAEGTGIKFIGVDPHIYEHLSTYDVLIHPTESKSEGFPTIIIQAASKGLPVITTEFNGYDSALSSKNCLLSRPGDIAGLKNNIQKIINEPDMIYPKQIELHKSFRLRFESKVTTKAMLALYSGESAGMN